MGRSDGAGFVGADIDVGALDAGVAVEVGISLGDDSYRRPR